MSKLWFILKKKLIHQIGGSVTAFISFLIAFCMLLVSFGFVAFFSHLIDHTKQYSKNLRAFSVSSDSSHTNTDIREIFKNNPHVAAIMIEDEEVSDLLYLDQYSFQADACNEKTMPEIVSGRGLDFTKNNEIVLPEKMKMFDEESGKYISINSGDLIGNAIKVSLYDVYDYTDVGKTFTINVVGTYDSEKYMTKDFKAYVTSGCAHVLHADDIDYTSDNHTLKLYTDSVENNDSVISLAVSNHLYYSSVSSSLTVLNIGRVVSVIFSVLILAAATAVAGYAVRIDFQRNIRDYYMMKVFGYREEKLYNIIAARFIIVSFASVIFSVPFVNMFNSKLSSVLASRIQSGGISLHTDFNVFLFGLAVLYVIILLSVARYFLDFLKVRIQDI